MIDTDRKLLTAYLGECWHEQDDRYETMHVCKICKQRVGPNRIFSTEPDMMALYRRMVEKKGEEFCNCVGEKWESIRCYVDMDIPDFTAWLFCLSGEGYEERCQVVADWLKEKAI